jgi:hypothetical protein
MSLTADNMVGYDIDQINVEEPANSVSWIGNPDDDPRPILENLYSTRNFSPYALLDDSYTKITSIDGLKTTLYQHQQTLIRAAVDLEKTRTIKLRRSNIRYTGDFVTLTTSAGVISEAVGSGKTIVILGIILTQKLPKVIPSISEIALYKKQKYVEHTETSSCIVRKKFKNILLPTIVFAGASVVNQWVAAIHTFTSLKCFTVFDVKQLQMLIDMMADKSINRYDIVIVKNGKVTRPVTFPKNIIVEDKNKGRTITYIYNNIANMRNYCWARVVVDDFDTIRLPHNAGIVNGLFTWYVSSTAKVMNSRSTENKQFKTTHEMLMYYNSDCSKILENSLMFHHLNIANKPEFIKTTNNISSPRFYAYVFDNPNNQYMGLLGLMGDSEASNIMEMLNGDAIDTAAAALGIKTTSVANIFQVMLGKQYDKFVMSTNVLQFIKDNEPMHGRRPPFSQNPDQEDTYKKSDLFIPRPIEWNYPNLRGLLDSTKDEYTDVLKKSSYAIERVKSNIKEGECPICSLELTDGDEEILILKCCGIIVCGLCCFGTIFPKKSVSGQCSNCRSPVIIQQSLIYLNKGFDLEKILENNLTEPDHEPEPEPELDPETGKPKENPKPRTKMTALLDIIYGRKPQDQIDVDVNIANLMKGTHNLPEPTYRKVLIFANFDETLDKIKTTLSEANVKSWTLGGSHSEINKTAQKFTDSTETCSLIINSMKHCSGLNLQTATDLIFTHKIIDRNIETQVAGRAQRLGRKNNLNIHFIFYQNEMDYMTRGNTMRLIVPRASQLVLPGIAETQSAE